MQGTWGLNYLNLNTSPVASPVISKELNPVLTRSNTWTHGKAKCTRKMASTPIIVEDVAQAEELNPVLTRSNTHGKAKSKRKTTSTPIIVEDVLEALEDVHDDKEQYSNSKNWSSDDFVNLACAWSQVSQNLATMNNQKATIFLFTVRDQFNSSYVVQSMWRSYNSVNCEYKGRLNKECLIFKSIIQDLESRHHTGIGTDDFERMASNTFYQTQGKPFKLGEAYKVLETCPKWSQIHHIGHPARNVARKSNFNDSLEIGITPLDFTMLTSLPIDKYPTQLPIAHLRTYLIVIDDRSNDSMVAHAFILFMMEYLWFQTANDTVPLGYLGAVADSDETPLYEWGSTILASLYHGLDTAVTTGGAITGFLLLLEYWFYEYYGVSHPIVNNALKMTSYPCLKLTGYTGIPMDPPSNMLVHLSPTDLHAFRESGFVDCDQFVMDGERYSYDMYWHIQTQEVGHLLTDSQRMGNIDMFGPNLLRAGIIPMVVTSAEVHSLSQDFTPPDLEMGPDLG
ncbi:hypothetical protein GIB67_008862 [Kingdonia uniflora]|uniref:Aminotransferase-like plant mobile domain-containing protein n=1 Tax=Kingdonia uniflora TaxID=39325 RepID=A0A7J7LVA1_9MAGN|nr:hypothetical protein GIB67_008862 [Kingdonia uniflora]